MPGSEPPTVCVCVCVREVQKLEQKHQQRLIEESSPANNISEHQQTAAAPHTPTHTHTSKLVVGAGVGVGRG